MFHREKRNRELSKTAHFNTFKIQKTKIRKKKKNTFYLMTKVAHNAC